MNQIIGETWCQIEIYNEYLKKITGLLTQIQAVEKMQQKAEMELDLLKDKALDSSRQQYEARLNSKQRWNLICVKIRH